MENIVRKPPINTRRYIWNRYSEILAYVDDMHLKRTKSELEGIFKCFKEAAAIQCLKIQIKYMIIINIKNKHKQ